MARRTREELREMFKTGAQPTGSDFRDFIESIVNAQDDKLRKPPEAHNPLRIEASGEDQNLLDFFEDEKSHSWRISQYKGGRPGLNFESGLGDSRVFIQQSNGDVGISTLKPKARMHVSQENTDTDAIRVDDSTEDATPFIVTNDGRVGIRKEKPDAGVSLHIGEGSLKFEEGVAVDQITNDDLTQNSNTSLPTGTAVMNFIADMFVGSVSAFAMKIAPNGWLECKGQELLRSEYSRLYARIGDTYGVGDGSTTFLLPDLRSEFIRGWDNGRGVDNNRSFGVLQADELQGHNHEDGGHGHTDDGHDHWRNPQHYAELAWTNAAPNGTHAVDGGPHDTILSQAHVQTGHANIQSGKADLGDPMDSGTGAGTPRYGDETRPRNIAMLYCIKY